MCDSEIYENVILFNAIVVGGIQKWKKSRHFSPSLFIGFSFFFYFLFLPSILSLFYLIDFFLSYWFPFGKEKNMCANNVNENEYSID